MNIEQMKQVLKEILTHTDLTACVVGHRGVGKTAGIIQVCSELGRNYTALRLGQMEVGDLVGIPYREGKVMHWSRPCWWPDTSDDAAIVHCDELNRAQQEDALQAIFQFVEPPPPGQQRGLHTHRLDPKHKVVVSINPPDGSYQVVSLDRALLDRMVLLFVETDYACWAGYAKAQSFDGEVQRFLAGYPALLSKPGLPFDMSVEPSERAWEMVSTLRRQCRLPVDLEMEVYAGIVGPEAAVSFLRWCREQTEQPVSADELLNDWSQVADRVIAQREDQNAAMINDLLASLAANPAMTDKQEKNLVACIASLPRDLRFGLVKALVRMPEIAERLCKDEYDDVILEVMAAISQEAG